MMHNVGTSNRKRSIKSEYFLTWLTQIQQSIYFYNCLLIITIICLCLIINSQMSEQNIVRAKKSSRLNPKKQQKIQIQVDSSWKPGIINIIIQYEDKIHENPKNIKDFKVYYTHNGGLVTKYLLEQLKNEKAIKQQTSLSFYCETKKIYVYVITVPLNIDQIPADSQIDSKFITKDTIKIKVRSKKKIAIDALIQEQRIKYDEVEEEKNNKGQKEKKIGEVVQKVALWRKFYTGFYDEDGNYFQKPLQSAAQQVGIAKKTLDDYLLQIRNGKKYGFNFNQKFNSKIGQLRAFVRDQKKKAQQK